MDALKGLLKGKKALVTGGGVNIGRAVALALAGAGADVAVIYQNSEEAAAEVISRIEAQGRRGLALKADITREEEVGAAFSRLSGDWGSLDILVNNSGIFSISPQAELSLEEWDRIWKVNMGGLFLCCREAFSLLPRGGSVVNLASINAFHPGFGETVHYDASKGGVMAYTRSLAAEWAPRKIRVNAVAPGLVDSPRLREENEDLARQVEKRTPLGALVKPEEVADTALYLVSPLASQMTGQTLIVDGGYLLS